MRVLGRYLVPLLACVCCLCVAVPVHAADVKDTTLCYFPDADGMYTRQQALDCLDATQFDADRASEVVTAQREWFTEEYVFTPYYMDPPGPYDTTPLDLVHEVQKLGEQTWESDAAFHIAMRGLVMGLNDPHT
ncbi:hypothetical protein KIPB_007757, partial [Kipferlia bialata]|eukprot:g7757.t1